MVIPKHRQDNGQPDGDRVYDDAEAGVELHESDGLQAVPFRGRLRAVEHVEAEGKRQIGDHGQSVRHGKSGQDTVRRRNHVLSS